MDSAGNDFYLDGDDLIVPSAVELDVSTADGILRVTETALTTATSAKRLVIDLSGTSFIDSAGLGALLTMLNAARVRGIPMHLQGLSPQLRRLLEITGLTPVFDVSPPS